MTLHKHWSVPAHADEVQAPVAETVTPIANTPVTPVLTHVYIGRQEYDGDSTTKVFSTREACVAWRDSLCGDYDDFEIYHREILN